MIVTVRGRDRAECPDIFNRLFKFRYDVFVKKLRWTLPTKGNLEIDQYDNADAVYFYYVDDDGFISSHVRLTPTTTSSLLADYFPHLADSPHDVRTPNVYEATRYIVLPRKKTASSNRASKAELLLAVNEWARAHGITHTQTIIETSLLGSFMEMSSEVRPLGLSHPYGGGPEIEGGGEAIAIRCPANEKVIRDLRKYGGLVNGVASYRSLRPAFELT
jgi:N-acyl-L-homoserine lactone synthetase